MTTTTHTPGPWIYDSRYNNVIDEDGRVIAARPSYSSAAVDTEMADMRLIAAAPKLLEALKLAYEQLGLWIESIKWDQSDEDAMTEIWKTIVDAEGSN